MGGRDLSVPAQLLAAWTTAAAVGELVALTDDGTTPLVVRPDQPGAAALRARSTVDLHAAHIGASVVLLFEGGDPQRPIVIGVLRSGLREEAAKAPVVIETDGERLVVDAKEQLVLRCGKARITLTAAGKVLIEGSYVSSRSTGVNRIKGGSVQLN
jgi:uncharacterized protein (DUF2345 family)